MTQASQQPFPLATDVPQSGVVPTDPQQVPPPPAWFAHWEATTFRPFQAEVRAKLTWAKVAQLAVVGGLGYAANEFPQFAQFLKPLLTILGTG